MEHSGNLTPFVRFQIGEVDSFTKTFYHCRNHDFMVTQRTLYPKSMNKHEEVCFNTINYHDIFWNV